MFPACLHQVELFNRMTALPVELGIVTNICVTSFKVSSAYSISGVYKQWTGLLEWWNSGLESFCSYFHYFV